MELQNHPYFVGVQFHPEFKSRPGKPSALFLGKNPWLCSIMARTCVDSVCGILLRNVLYKTGLIAAASGCLEAVLQASGKMNKVLINGMANGTAMGKFYMNGNVYSNGNGLHH